MFMRTWMCFAVPFGVRRQLHNRHGIFSRQGSMHFGTVARVVDTRVDVTGTA